MNTLLPWGLAIGVVTIRDINQYQRPPLPSEFVATGVLFAAATVLAQANPQLAAVFSWGILAAVILKAAPGGGITKRTVPAQGTPTTKPKKGGK